MLTKVTFTGIDATTDMGKVSRLAARYPWAEFAVLVGTNTGHDTNPIFPSMPVINALRATLRQRQTAIHLCGIYARTALGKGNSTLRPRELYSLCAGFGRVQINLPTGAGVSAAERNHVQALARFREIDGVVLQHRSGWESVPMREPNVEYLFDLSGGLGLEQFHLWPEPPRPRIHIDSPLNLRVGYAGGMGPHNMGQALEFVDRYPESSMWLDMERNVRTEDARSLDIAKVWAVCAQVEAHYQGWTP